MPYTIEKKETQVVLHFTLLWEEMREDFEKRIAAAGKGASVKGFRKGKVPKDVAEKTIDRHAVLSDSVDHVLRDEYASAVKKEDLKFAGAPQVAIKKLAEGNDVEIELTAELMPDVALPKNWKKIVTQVNKDNSVSSVEVKDEDVEKELKNLALSRATKKSVERSAQKDDHVTVDFIVKQDGVIIEGGTSKDHALVLGTGVFIPGFEEQVIGMEVGEEKTFELPFPQEYHAKHLAGKPATFEVTLKTVEEQIVPEIDDAFASSLGAQFKTLEDFRKALRGNMESELEKGAVEAKRAQYLEKIAAEVSLAIPAALNASELDRMVGEMEQQVSASGTTFDDYAQRMGKTREELREAWKPQADQRIISALILEKLGDEFDAMPSSEEIEEEMNTMMQMYQGIEDVKDKIDMEQLYAYTQGIKRNEKVFAELEKL